MFRYRSESYDCREICLLIIFSPQFTRRMAASSSTGGHGKESTRASEPVYTRKLIPRIYIDPFEIDKNFDEEAWYKKAYGPDVIIDRKQKCLKGRW